MDLVETVGLDWSLKDGGKRKLATLGGACAILVAAEYYGLISTSFRWFRRYINVSIAQWLEHQGGFPLYTIEGEEPEESKVSWKLPRFRSLASKGAADVANQLQPPPDSRDMPTFPSNSSPSRSADGQLPNFFASTKFFSCLEMRESQELFEATRMVTVQPHELLFNVGESSEPGIFIVLEGQLGVYVNEGDGSRLISRLETGESIGDFDILDGARRSVACKALEDGATLVQVSRELFMRFVAAKPQTLQIYLHKAMARLWRVAHFVLSDFLNLSLEQTCCSTTSEIAQTAGVIQRAMNQEEARRELKQARKQLRKSEGENNSPGKTKLTDEFGHRDQEDAKRKGTGKDQASEEDSPMSSQSEVFQLEHSKDETSSEALKRSAGEASTSGLPQTTPVSKTPIPGSKTPQVSNPSRNRSQRFQPRLPAVKERTLEQNSSRNTSSAALASLELDLEPQVSIDASGIAPSPFAQMSHQDTEADQLDFEPLELDDASSNGTDGDSVIVSSIKSAMTQMRAASLPAALIRPAAIVNEEGPEGTSPVGSVQGDSPRSPKPAQAHGRHVAAGQACLEQGWDVICPEEYSMSSSLQQKLGLTSSWRPGRPPKSCPEFGTLVHLTRGDKLQSKDQVCRGFSILLSGRLIAERTRGNGRKESMQIMPGSLISCASFLSSSRTREVIRVAERSAIIVFEPQELALLKASASDCFVELLLAAARALGPVIRRFLSLGLNRVWFTAGEAAYRQGEEASCLYIIISGRLRLVRENSAAKPPVRVEEEVGRGEAVGAIWALAGGQHDTSALCVRDAELVRMSRAAFELISMKCPHAVVGMLNGISKRLAAASVTRSHHSIYDPTGRAAVSTPVPAPSSQQDGAAGGGSAKRGEIVTIALVPTGCEKGKGHALPESASIAVEKLGGVLKHTLEELFGPTLHLSSSSMELMFPTSFQRLGNAFYRSKVTSWMAAQEEDYRFIVMEADDEMSPWTKICISHADCILLVAPEDAAPAVNEIEHTLIWAPMGPPPRSKSKLSSEHNALLQEYQDTAQEFVDARSYAARMRRVELVLLHTPGSEPKDTSQWLRHRPFLSRHHHIRPSHSKDLARLGRWMAGKAIGLVLSGGGSRGLAHLGVLHALDDAGVPVDVIGGTSQGAFMAGLFAQGVPWEQMHRTVRSYASQMSSVRHLIWDLTLPLVSIFTGRGFDKVVRESFHNGAQDIEDLWLRYFCMTTNLSRGEPSVHEAGLLWKLVRASMTIVGLVPPVYHEGELLVDGGYMNNIPVDVMRGLGVDTVIVVDVEDKDASVWRNLSAYDGGLSGWRLLWDRWCPIPSLRYGIKTPKYQQIISHLTWMSHAQNLKRVSREHVIDLYLQPPVTKFRLMDFVFLERIVRDANRYAFGAIAEWQCRQGVSQQGMCGTRTLRDTEQLKLRRAHSIPCMTQLQMKNVSGREESMALDSSRADVQTGPTTAEQTRQACDVLLELVDADSLSKASMDLDTRDSMNHSLEANKPRGLFGIHGPTAGPSESDLNGLNDPKKTIQSLPSRKAMKSVLSMRLMEERTGNLPSLQSRDKALTARALTEENETDLLEFPSPEEPRSSSFMSSSSTDNFQWMGPSGAGPLALPNPSILPEDYQKRRLPPEVRKASIRDDLPITASPAAARTAGLAVRPSFKEESSDGTRDDAFAALLEGVERAHSIKSSTTSSAQYPSQPAVRRERRKSSLITAPHSAPHISNLD